MLKGLLKTPDGKADLVFLGITARNVGKLKESKPILIHGAEIGITFDICIAYEETEALLTEKVSKYIGKDTVIRDIRTEQQKLDDLMATEAARHKMGATGDYPEGSQNAIDETDEGGLRVGIVAHEGNVLINFGKKIAWVGLPPDAAIEFANSIIAGAKQALDNTTKS